MYDVDEVVDEKTVLNSSETGDLVVATAIYTTPPPPPPPLAHCSHIRARLPASRKKYGAGPDCILIYQTCCKLPRSCIRPPCVIVKVATNRGCFRSSGSLNRPRTFDRNRPSLPAAPRRFRNDKTCNIDRSSHFLPYSHSSL